MSEEPRKEMAEFELEEAEDFVPRDEEMEDEDTSSDEDMGDANGEDATTTDGGGGGEATDGSQSKKARKDRNPITIGLKRSIFTSVSDKGVPLEPAEFVAGYSLQLSAILRNTVTINTENLKADENERYRHQLFRKLHARYAYPGDEDNKYNNDNLKGNPVNKYALKKMTKALSNWKNRVKKLIYNDKLSYEEVVKKEPLVKEEDFKVFKARCDSAAGKAKSMRGKELHDLNIGTHHLGSGGYRVAIPKWEKEDAVALKEGKTPPFANIADKQARNFVRARHAKPKGSSEYSSEPSGPSGPKVKDFMEKYVSNLHASRLIAFTMNQ